MRAAGPPGPVVCVLAGRRLRGPVAQLVQSASLSSWKSRVQVPSGPPGSYNTLLAEGARCWAPSAVRFQACRARPGIDGSQSRTRRREASTVPCFARRHTSRAHRIPCLRCLACTDSLALRDGIRLRTASPDRPPRRRLDAYGTAVAAAPDRPDCASGARLARLHSAAVTDACEGRGIPKRPPPAGCLALRPGDGEGVVASAMRRARMLWARFQRSAGRRACTSHDAEAARPLDTSCGPWTGSTRAPPLRACELQDMIAAAAGVDRSMAKEMPLTTQVCS
jgi:hypothetical protein